MNQGLSREEAEVEAKKALQHVGFKEENYSKSPFELSGGQKKRVAIAGVLAMNPKILILDEPTAGLDPKGRDDILDQIAELHKVRGITIILVSHSMEDIAKYAERLIVVNDGEIAYDDAPKAVFAHYRELEAMGLAAPQITYIMHALKEKGLDVDVTATTVEEAKENILAVLKKTAPEKLLRTDEKENKGGQEHDPRHYIRTVLSCQICSSQNGPKSEAGRYTCIYYFCICISYISGICSSNFISGRHDHNLKSSAEIHVQGTESNRNAAYDHCSI